MKYFVRFFFKTLRIVLGPLMLLKEALTRPQGMVRSTAGQDSVDQSCRALALYQYTTCPLCITVRPEMRRLSLKITQVDAQPEGPARAELTQQGGHTKVPCLKITDEAGNSHWLYDSEKIIAYLRSNFAQVV